MAFKRRRYSKKRFATRKKARFTKRMFRPRKKADTGYLEKLTATGNMVVDAGGTFAQF